MKVRRFKAEAVQLAGRQRRSQNGCCGVVLYVWACCKSVSRNGPSPTMRSLQSGSRASTAGSAAIKLSSPLNHTSRAMQPNTSALGARPSAARVVSRLGKAASKRVGDMPLAIAWALRAGKSDKATMRCRMRSETVMTACVVAAKSNLSYNQNYLDQITLIN